MPADIALDVGGHYGFAIDQFLVWRWAERHAELSRGHRVACSEHVLYKQVLYK